jgi:hypothetical protein
MAVKLSVIGLRYDDAVPAFTLTPAGYYCRLDHKLRQRKSFEAWLAKHKLSFAPGEVGEFPKWYTDRNPGMLWDKLPAGPITGAVTTPGGAIDVAGVISFSGGPADKAYVVTITTAVDAGPDVVRTVNVAKDDVPVEVAGAVAALVIPEITLTTSGHEVTFTPATGKALTKLTVSVA